MATVMKWGEMLVAVGFAMFMILNAGQFGTFLKAVVSNSVGLVSGVARA